MRSQCPDCGLFYKIVQAHLGRTIQCKKCGNSFVIEEAVANEKQPPAAQPKNHLQPPTNAGQTVPEMKQSLRSQCPGCGLFYKIVQAHLGRTIKCQKCGNSFVIEAVADKKLPPAAQSKKKIQPPPSARQDDSAQTANDDKREKEASPQNLTSFSEGSNSDISPQTKNRKNSDLRQQPGGVVPFMLEQNQVQNLSNNTFFKWFIAVNAGVMITAMILLQNVLWPLLITIIGFAGSFISLFFSKSLAMRIHRIKPISPQQFKNDDERTVYEMVQKLAQNAGLPKTPDVAIYKSPDMNAFATGASQDNSLVAFSSALMKKLSWSEIQAVAAHEIAHIANHDMLGTVLIQGVINTLALLVTIPFKVIQGLHIALSNEDDIFATLNGWAIKLAGFLAHITVMAIGTLCSLAFSRKREYRADRMAALMVGNENMISALIRLKEDGVAAPVSQAEFAAFKVSGQISLAELFSTHPEMDKRIEALRQPESVASPQCAPPPSLKEQLQSTSQKVEDLTQKNLREQPIITPVPSSQTQSTVHPGFTVGQILSSTFSTLCKKPVIFFELAITASAPAVIFLIKFADEFASRDDVVLISITGILNSVFFTFMEAWVVYAVFRVLREEMVTEGEVCDFVKDRTWPLLGAGFLFLVAIGLGLVFFVIPGLFLMISLAMVIPICAVERLGAVDSLKRSGQLTKGYRLPIFGLYVIDGLLSLALLFAFEIVLSNLSIGFTAYTIASALLCTIPVAFGSVMTAVIYFKLREVKEGISLNSLAGAFELKQDEKSTEK